MCWPPDRLEDLQHDGIKDAALQQQVRQGRRVGAYRESCEEICCDLSATDMGGGQQWEADSETVTQRVPAYLHLWLEVLGDWGYP